MDFTTHISRPSFGRASFSTEILSAHVELDSPSYFRAGGFATEPGSRDFASHRDQRIGPQAFNGVFGAGYWSSLVIHHIKPGSTGGVGERAIHIWYLCKRRNGFKSRSITGGESV